MTDENLDDTIRRALARGADSVEPGSEGLHEIRRKIRETRPTSRRPWLLTTGGAVLGTAAAVGLFAVLDKEQTPQVGDGQSVAGQPTTSPSTSPSVSPSAGPSATPETPASPVRPPPTKTAAVPVYWMGEVVGRPDLGPRLYRTFVRVDGAPAEEAVRVLATGRPDDPDYSTAWTGARVVSVSRADRTITVDFEELPDRRLGSEAAEVAAQALVHTVQGTLSSTDPVRVTLNGGPAGNLFGHVDTSKPLRRSPAADVQAAVWIINPTNNAKVSPPFKVDGIASVYEANVSWQIWSTPSRKPVARGFTTASAGGPDFGTFNFAVLKLPRGTYILECFESSPEDGRPTFTDSKTITVR